MDFTKMQGAGNDFVVVDARHIRRNWPKLAITLCDRHFGIGADSLIILLPSKKADIRMRTFDADGSEAETCGNGIRCVARYLLEKGLVNRSSCEITIETLATVNSVVCEKRGRRVIRFWANMGRPQLALEKIPAVIGQDAAGVVNTGGMTGFDTEVNGTRLHLNLVSMGNPHAVYFTSGPVADFPLGKIGPLVERLPVFPKRVNFEVTRVLDRRHLEARVWERGVGETLACGSGTCAITVASKLLGYTDAKVEVTLPGGPLEAEWNGQGEVILGGPAEMVYEGQWPD